MAEKKRGLHRGLEALLMDTAVPKITQPSLAQAQLTKTEALIAALQQENRQLQQEAAVFVNLLQDVESLLLRIKQE